MPGRMYGLLYADVTELSTIEAIWDDCIFIKKPTDTNPCWFVFFEGIHSLECVFVKRQLNAACNRVDVQYNSISLFTDLTDYACQKHAVTD